MGVLDDAIREHLELKRRRGADPSEIERLEREALGPVRRRGYDADEMPPEDESAAELSQPGDQATELWSEVPDEPGFTDHGADFDEPGFTDHRTEFERESEDWEASDVGDTVLDPDVAPPVRPVPPPPDDDAPERGRVQEDEFVDEDELEEQETVEHDVEGEYAEDSGRESRGSGQSEYPAPPEPGSSAPSEPGSSAPPESESSDLQERGRREPPEADHPGNPGREDMLEETPEFLQDTPDHDRLWFEQRPPRDFDFDG
jgi:hypothetical protein